MKRKMRLEFYHIKKVRFRGGYSQQYSEHRWRLTAPNGRIVLASTEGYATKAGAKRNWARMVEVMYAAHFGDGIEEVE